MKMLLRDWTPEFNLKIDMLKTRSLCKIGNALGKPIVTDECTTAKMRVSYARVLVETDNTYDMPKGYNC